MRSDKMRISESVKSHSSPIPRGRCVRLHGPRPVADQTDTGADQQLADQPAEASSGRLIQEHDSLLQRVGRRPVTAERKGAICELCSQHGSRIALSRVGVISHDGCVAGQFLVESTQPRANVNQRIEPKKATRESPQGVRHQIAAADVHPFVRENERLFLGGVADLEIARQDDCRPHDADHDRAARGNGRAKHLPIAPDRQPKTGHEPPLLTRESCAKHERADCPRAQQPCRPIETGRHGNHSNLPCEQGH